VAADLAGLHGPGEGTLEVPRRLYWSGDEDCGSVDLADPAQVAAAYAAILNVAATEDDLSTYLNATLLARLWPYLGMSLARRRAWEARNPELAVSGAGQATAA
jgi:hypothetical protein